MYLYFQSTEIANLISLSLAPFTSSGHIQVWIQAIKVGQYWRFHDGSPLTFAFPTSMTNNPDELHIRCKSVNNFECRDDSETRDRHFMCEYYRQFL